MNNRLKARLENAIQKWVDANCEKNDWPDAWIYENQVEDMAQAASMIFDASVKAQYFANDNE